MASSTDMAPYLSLTDQYRLRISLPDIVVQKFSAAVLAALDDKIAVNDRIAVTSEALAVALSSDERWPSVVPLGELVAHLRNQVSPETLNSELVAHYSLPAFDSARLPEAVSPASIKSGKFLIDVPCVLLSKLNPATPRVWDLAKLPDIPCLASTEFLVLQPKGKATTHELWAVCSQSGFTEELAGKVTGTSNSHQRVNPADLLATQVVDPRDISDDVRNLISDLSGTANAAREEARVLAALRNTLLPWLISGEIRVRDAEKIVEDAT
jgi:type I restriction enzyme S subunit